MNDKSTGRLALGPFLRQVEARLEELSHEELKAVLLEHARRLGPEERPPFAGLLAGPAPAASEASDPGLNPDIEAFLEDLVEGHYFDGWDWDEELQEERPWGDESWADVMDELFGRAAAAFLRGDRALAAESYRRLLQAFFLNDETFCGPLAPEEMVQTDIEEARSRYLRSLYDTLPREQRAPRLIEELRALEPLGNWNDVLRSVADADAAPLPELEAFLDEWLQTLRRPEEEDHGREALRGLLLREAVQLKQGPEGLAELARGQAPGSGDPEAYEAWVQSLLEAGRPEDAAAAAREAWKALEEGSLRARLADRVASAAAERGDAAFALEARREAWSSRPTLGSLQRLCIAIEQNGETLQAGLAPELRSARQPGKSFSRRLRFVLELLTGETEPALETLDQATSTRESAREEPMSALLPVLLLAGSGMEAPVEGSAMAELWLGLEAPEPGLFPSGAAALELDEADPGPEEALSDPGEPASGEPAEGFPEPFDLDEELPPESLGSLLQAALARHPRTEAQRGRFLDIARSLIAEQAMDLEPETPEEASRRVAQLAVACAEAFRLGGRAAEGRDLLEGLRTTGPARLVVELEAWAGASPLLSSRSRKR